ncbi:MAG: Rossmann-like and DUF2520 domain-containing protein [Planctomycetaceae bacterium]
MRIAFVGCGAAGRPLGIAWRRAGHALGAVICRRSAGEAVRAMGGGGAGGDLREADVVVFATPDDALDAAARAHRLRPDQVAIHLSGAHPSTLLASTGARTAGLHPLRAFAELEASLRGLPGTFCFVEGAAVEVAERLARDAGGVPVRIETGRKLLYHAGATVASNYLVTLLDWGARLLTRAGVARERGEEALLALMRGALDNAQALGLPQALTGPAARGDAALVADHLQALAGEERALYRALLWATLPLAKGKGALGDDAERALRRLAEES